MLRLWTALVCLSCIACEADVGVETEAGYVFHAFPEETFAPELRDYALELHAEGVEGLELFSRVAHRAAEHWSGVGELTPPERFDATFRDLGLVFLGRTSYGLVDYFPIRLGLLRDFHVELERLDQQAGLDSYAAIGTTGALGETNLHNDLNIDVTPCLGFRPEFCDGTPNQVYHTFAYVYIAYVTGSAEITHVGNVVHERDGDPGTLNDLRVGYWGAVLGASMRRIRDSAWLFGDRHLPSIPFWIGAVLAKDAALSDGRSYGDASLPFNAEERIQAAQHLDEFVKDNLDGIGVDRVFFSIMKALCDCANN